MDTEKLVDQSEKEFFKVFNTGERFTSANTEKLVLNFLFDKKQRRKIAQDEAKLMVFRLFIETFCLKPPIFLKELMDSVERSIIVSILSKVDGNQKKAAKILGIKYTTLNEKVKKYKIRFQKKPF